LFYYNYNNPYQIDMPFPGIRVSAWLGAMLITSGLLPFPAHPTNNGLSMVQATATPEIPPLFERTVKKHKRTTPISIPIHRRSTRASTSTAVINKRADEVEFARAVLERDASRLRNFVRRNTDDGAGEGLGQGGNGGDKKEKRAGWETVPISSYHGDAFYYASVQIGTPPQTSESSLHHFTISLLAYSH
jgi:hypothetical protein